MKARIGRYRIDGPLGEGGMGVVYAAHDEQLERDIAVKVLRGLDDDPVGRERMRREARAAASVSHPNICHIYEVGEDEQTIFIAMERLAGEPLAVRLARGPLPIAEACTVALGILSALEALHARQIVHRDLKPANVHLTPHGVKLLDFGLAHGGKASGADVRVTATGVLLGTPRYMAPEQLQGQDAGPKTDQFAFGALLYEMLTGRPAFAGNTVWEVAEAVRYHEAPALAGGAAAAALERVIHRCLAKRPEDRYEDPGAIADGIRAASALDHNEGTQIRPATRLMVLPFRLLRADAEIDFLGFSLADALVASLTGLGSLVVRSSHVAQQIGAIDPGALDLRRIAAEAQVDAVLTGSLLRAGEQLRVVAQLVETPGGTILWSTTAQVRMGDVFQLQDDVARQIVASLSIPLTARDRGRLGRDVPASGHAYELYLRANHIAHDTVLPGPLLAARELYLASIEEDPNYAPVWARLGRVCRVLAKYSARPHEAHAREAEDAFRRAFALSPDLPLAHHLYTYFEIEQLGRATAAMTRLLDRVREMPNDPDLFAGLVVAFRYCGLLEASLAADARARQLDPSVSTSVHYTYFLLNDLEKLREFTNPDAIYAAGVALMQAGDDAEARRLFAAVRGNARAVEQMFVDAMEASADLRVDDVKAVVARIDASGFNDPEGFAFFACALTHAGLTEDAMAMLGDVLARGYVCPSLAEQRWLAPLAGDDRFVELMTQASEARASAHALFVGADGPHLLGMSG